MNSKYRFLSYTTPSATWTYDQVKNEVTLFWKANGNKIKYGPHTKNFVVRKKCNYCSYK